MSGFSNNRSPVGQALFQATFRYIRAEVRDPLSLVGMKTSFKFEYGGEELAVFGTISGVTFAHEILTLFLSVPSINGHIIHNFFANEGEWYVTLSPKGDPTEKSYKCRVDTMLS